ncbi:MAG: hypothetical protein IT442_10290 [Phycisphaeraceae bacterium]|nr:hypothetical protein [Phycisphaeraceae bacterium]
MDHLDHCLRVAGRRLVWQAVLIWAGWSALGLALLAAIGIVLHRIQLWDSSAWPMVDPWKALAITLAAILLVSLGAGVLVALLTRRSPVAVAGLIDHRLELKDRFGSALYCKPRAQDDPFAEQVFTDAREKARDLAGSSQLRQAFALHLPRHWMGSALITLLAVSLFLFLPTDLDPFGLAAARAEQAAAQRQAAEARENIAKAQETLEQLKQLVVSNNTTQSLEMAKLQAQLQELTERNLDQPRTQRQLTAEVSAVHDQLASLAQQQEKQLQPLETAMSQLDPKTTGPADAFADALRRGDFQAAAAALDQLTAQMPNLSDEEKDSLKQQIENLSQQLQSAAAEQARQQQELEKSLSDAGLSQQQIQQLAQGQMDPNALQQALAQRGLSPEEAQRLAEQAQQLQGQNSQCMNSLSQGLNQMAQSMNNPSQGQQGQQGQNQAQQTLNQMAQMQSAMNQYRQAQNQLSNAMGGNGQKPGDNGNGQGGAGQGGIMAGTEEGNDPIGREKWTTGTDSTAVSDAHDSQGRVLASWLTPGGAIKGDAQVEFDQTVTAAQSEAEKAVTEDRVPRRYRSTVHNYFDQLPKSEDLPAESAPKAPR